MNTVAYVDCGAVVPKWEATIRGNLMDGSAQAWCRACHNPHPSLVAAEPEPAQEIGRRNWFSRLVGAA